MPVTPIIAPAGVVPELALCFAGPDGGAAPVSAAAPLPVAGPAALPATSVALAGQASASATVGPFAPQLGRPIWLTLAGGWTGTATLLRSTDGGTTRLPLTAGGQPWGAFTANGQEPVAEETAAGATYYLQLALTGGSVAYRVAQ